MNNTILDYKHNELERLILNTDIFTAYRNAGYSEAELVNSNIDFLFLDEVLGFLEIEYLDPSSEEIEEKMWDIRIDLAAEMRFYLTH